MPRMNLEGSSSIVTGGASGIGEGCARQLAAAGSRVVIADLNEDTGQAVASELGGLFVRCDVSSVEDAKTAVAAASEMGPLRALVNSAGIGWAAVLVPAVHREWAGSRRICYSSAGPTSWVSRVMSMSCESITPPASSGTFQVSP